MGQDVSDHIAKYCAAVRGAYSSGGLDGFEAWFCPLGRNGAMDQLRIGAFWNFAQIITPVVAANIPNPWETTALEIGCGGGRLMAASCRFFRRVVGVDVHDRLDLTRLALERRGVFNFGVIRSGGGDIPVPDGEVGFIYSFIVFLHLASIDQFRSYLRESRRVLKKGGIAQLYYKPSTRSDAFIEASAGANEASLEIAERYAEAEVKGVGFEIIDRGWSAKHDERGDFVRGGQRYITARR